MTYNISELKKVTELKLMLSRKKILALQEKEREIRNDIKKISLAAQNTFEPSPENQSMRLIGADVHWRGWLDKKKAEKITELAQVLAQLEPMKVSANEDLGRDEAAKSLDIKETYQRLKMDRAGELQRAIDNYVLQQLL